MGEPRHSASPEPRHLGYGRRTRQKETHRTAHLADLKEVVPLPVEEVDVGFIHDANFLHSFFQIRGLGKSLRAVEIR